MISRLSITRRRSLVNKLLCFLFGHRLVMTQVEGYGHESVEYQIMYFKCDRCGYKKQKREDY